MPNRLKFLCGNGLAAFLDFSVGTFVTAVIFSYYGVDSTLIALFVGGWLALLPDFDILPHILKGKDIELDHRQTLLHRPILVVPVLTVIAYGIFGPVWAIVAFTCVTWHFLHDTDFIAKRYGIAWFWPISKRFWSWFGSYSPPIQTGHHKWLEQNWVKVSRLSLSEVILGSLALLGTFLVTNHLEVLISLVGVWIFVLYFWVVRFLFTTSF